MNVLNLLQNIETGIEKYKNDLDACPALRALTIHREVILYLIEKKKITASDEEMTYYDFIRNYTPRDLYKVAEHYRNSKGRGKLNYSVYQKEKIE